jgi:hypothetical protein
VLTHFLEFPSYPVFDRIFFFDLAASSSELAALNLYGLLTALPKYNHTNAGREAAKQESLAENERKEMVEK